MSVAGSNPTEGMKACLVFSVLSSDDRDLVSLTLYTKYFVSIKVQGKSTIQGGKQ
jgi:hypothetical protein